MNNQTFKIKTNDTRPALQVIILTKGELAKPMPMNLSSVSGVTFTMVDECNNDKIFSQSGSVICNSGGTIQYQWQDGDTDTNGFFFGEFKLNFNDGTRMSVPYLGGIRIEITNSINNF